MISNVERMQPELMDVVRLFPGAEELDLAHELTEDGGRHLLFEGGVLVSDTPSEAKGLSGNEYKSLIKREAKLALYRFLSEKYKRELPWGSLTGIRPTRLAYRELERGADFRPLFRKMGVSKENIELTARVIQGQKGVLEKGEGNVDLFLSLPFCPSKCVYCSFITAPIAGTRRFLPAYLDALSRETEAAGRLIKRLRSVYIGGGTPFVLEPEELRRVLSAVAPIRTNGCEYTVEAGRPDVFTPEKLDLCAEFGVTRICINAQSFSDRTLGAIGRKHTAEEVYRAFEMAKPYPFDVNCDLIAGLTGESLEEFRASVDAAISLSPANITVHTLCLKRGARLKEEHFLSQAPGRTGGAVVPLGDELLGEMISYSRRTLTEAGYEPYYLYRQKYMAGAHENVGWTKPKKACVYNVDVMEETADNLALGANAVSKRVFPNGRIERLGSPKDVPTYLEKADALISEKNALFA